MRRSRVWVVAIAMTGLLGCKTRQASVDKAGGAPNAAVPTENELERPAIPASEHAAIRRRLVTVMSKHPEAYLTLRGETPSLDLHPRVAKPISLRLAVPGVERWADANIGRFDVRSGATQESLSYDKVDSEGAVRYTFSHGGPAMFMFCAGPKVEPPVGALWEKVTHCSKVIVDVTDEKAHDRAPAVSVTHETGMPIEVTPMVAPVDLAVGSELPVVFGYHNEEQENLDVAALRPDGSIDHQITSRVGMAHFQISQAGRWVIRFVKTVPDGEHVGELVFTIAETK